MERIRQSGQRVEKLDKTLIDHHIAELDFQISRQLDAVMHHQEFQQVESPPSIIVILSVMSVPIYSAGMLTG
ncbi:EvpB/family type VI secretion protein [Klebsiella variicola]|nr:EvpB/family type VI secretion protein [Klebsiella variicola]